MKKNGQSKNGKLFQQIVELRQEDDKICKERNTLLQQPKYKKPNEIYQHGGKLAEQIEALRQKNIE